MPRRKRNKVDDTLYEVKIEKLVHGGQGMGRLADGRVVFLWNALAGETVKARLTKSKKDFAEGIAVEIVVPSDDRLSELAQTDIELSTQPWSIMGYPAELRTKVSVLTETFEREGLQIDVDDIHTKGSLSGYRNKVEFSFYGDEEGLHYAHYLRASHHKVVLRYPFNSLIPVQMADKAHTVLTALREVGVRAGDLKSVIIRSDQGMPTDAKVATALFVKTKDFPKIDVTNMAVYYSNPKSPASVPTELMYSNGSTELCDEIRGVSLHYDVLSFFQVNLPIFEVALDHISNEIGANKAIDLYSGVGSIGLTVGDSIISLVESDLANIEYAQRNAKSRNIEVIHAPSEAALEHITGKEIVIVDPPRAGLHADVVARLIDAMPPKIVYLSCNPSTQARDVAMLVKAGYMITRVEGYNFFPTTPHIESLVVLERS